ncbi:hypothetical protein AB0323_06670 [Arthrobacter sp. NPDC080031]|uniref:hypothetical protein n=1 Tax=Arthrobacter sp. NPDC080031 TaxID=3155918 RepID=UPI00344DED34
MNENEERAAAWREEARRLRAQAVAHEREADRENLIARELRDRAAELKNPIERIRREMRAAEALIRRKNAEKELLEFPDCVACTPTREVIAVNDIGARALGFTHEPTCPFRDDEDDFS